MFGTTILDNSSKLKLVDTLNEIILMPEIDEICIATGYWDLKGTSLVTDSLIKFLERDNAKLRLLIGKDPNVFKRDLTCQAYKNAKLYPQDYLKIDLQNIEMNDEQYQKAAKMLLDNCSGENPKIQVHIFDLNENDETQFFHSKCYIFMSTQGKTCGIIGSSNFTKMGLEGNSELNFLDVDSSHITAEPGEYSPFKGHYYWFNEKWNLSKDWTKEFVVEISSSPVGSKAKENALTNHLISKTDCLSPYENYIKLLQDKFGMITDANFKKILTNYLPEGIKPLEYQLNAVQQCYSYMIQHGGFALGDVVGLGKTIVGILLVKYYIENSAQLQKSDKVLVIVPPAIKSSWVQTIKLFDKNQTDKIENHISFITTGSLNHLGEDFSEDEMEDASDSALEDEDEKELTEEEKKQILNDDDTGFSNLSRSSDVFGLVIIDESHKFRNSNTNMYIALSEYLGSVNARTGYYPYIGLLSATMQNNSPRDIQNQIYLFEHEPKNSSFEKVEGRDLDHFFSQINAKYNTLIHQKKNAAGIDQADFSSDENTKKELIALSKEVREKVLSDILVRRTRTDIKKHYSDDLKFPEVHGPENLEYIMDKKLSKLFYDTMNMIAPSENPETGFGYYRYSATMYLDVKYQKVYSGRNMSAERSSKQLAKIMQILLVKRLESSFEAFKESLRNFKRYTQNMITMWEKDSIFICPQIDINKELNVAEKQKKSPDKKITIETCFDDIRKKIKKLDSEGRNQKNQNAEYKRDDFKKSDDGQKTYIDCLKEDYEKIESLLARWEENDFDPKREVFRGALRCQVKNPKNGKTQAPYLFDEKRNEVHKLVIFSEAISTVNSLSRDIENILGKEPLVITAANRTEMEETIRENFDANYDKSKQKNDYDVIITTEVLAEGINLHRANSILNYDTPWNATRLIQRIGRVNRIGSENTDIYVYNFYPSAEGDEQINLVKNAYTKLQSFHTMFGEDSKIFSQEEELSEGNFEAIIDGEESPQEKYIWELKEFKKQNKERYDFIFNLEKAEEKCIELQAQNNSGASYFAVKIKDKSGCIYVKVNEDFTASVISYEEMFKSCRELKNANQKNLCDVKDLEQKRQAAINEYNQFVNRQTKSKKRKEAVTEVLVKANDWIRSEKLNPESIALLGSAVKSIKKGNTVLANRLDKLLEELNDKCLLFPPTSEEIVNMIKDQLGNIAKENTKNYGQAYIFAGFYY